MFPVHCYVVNRRGLGTDDPMARQVSLLEKDVKDAAIKSAALSVGIQVGLMFVPVVGQAISAIISLVQFFTGKRYEKQTQQVIEAASNNIKAAANQARIEVDAAMSQAYEEELPEARLLALSPLPLEGLGDMWSSARDSLKNAAKKVIKVVAKVAVAPIKYTARVTLRGAQSLAARTGHATAAARFANIRHQSDKAANMVVQYSDPGNALNLLTGKEGYIAARDRANQIQATGIAQITAEKKATLATIQTPEYRENLRIDIARAIRGDPELFADVKALDESERHVISLLQQQLAAEQRAFQIPTMNASEIAAPAGQAAGAKLLVGGGLAAAALFFFNK